MKTDSQLKQDVSAELEWEPSVHAARIGVEAKDGVVTLAGRVSLSGDVDWQFQRQAATTGAGYLMGVTGVSDQISIKRLVTATAVESDIEAALEHTSIADAKTISVVVHCTDVTLPGTVHSWHERDTATNSAWGTPGVRNVVDTVTLAY